MPKTNDTNNPSNADSSRKLYEVADSDRVLKYRNGPNTLGIVIFCLAFGTFLGTLGEKGRVVTDFFSAVFDVIMKMVSAIMW